MNAFKSEVLEIDGVNQIKINVPWAVRFVSLYIFDVNGKTVLIDAGLDMGTWSRAFFKALREFGMTTESIDYCIITHHHLDHIGLTRKLKLKNPNIKIIMHDITDRVLKWETDKANIEEIEQEARNISMEMIKYGLSEEERRTLVKFFTYWPTMRKYQKPDVLVHDGDNILNTLKIIWTPGHSFGHICIFNTKTRHLFSGDHILSRITPHIGNYIIPAYISEDYKEYDFNNILKHYLSSLDKIDALNSKIIFPAHQEIIYNPRERISEIKKHHENRLSAISSVIKDNPLTPYSISKIHFGEDLDEINGFMALSEVLGHLLYLENEGKVQKIEKNGKLYYFH